MFKLDLCPNPKQQSEKPVPSNNDPKQDSHNENNNPKPNNDSFTTGARVQISGLNAAAELNGQTAVILQARITDFPALRHKVKIEETGDEYSIKEANLKIVVFKLGSRVEIFGLTSESGAALNGSQGEIVQLKIVDNPVVRHQVKVDGIYLVNLKNIKETNLKMVESNDEDDSDSDEGPDENLPEEVLYQKNIGKVGKNNVKVALKEFKFFSKKQLRVDIREYYTKDDAEYPSYKFGEGKGVILPVAAFEKLVGAKNTVISTNLQNEKKSNIELDKKGTTKKTAQVAELDFGKGEKKWGLELMDFWKKKGEKSFTKTKKYINLTKEM